jgi:hypothetical protein
LHDTQYVSVVSTNLTDLQTEWIDTLDASLFDTLSLAIAIAVAYPEDGSDTSYALFINDLSNAGPEELIFVLNDFIDLELIQKDGEVVPATSDIIPVETLAGCFNIKARLLFTAGEGDYLVRIIRTDAARKDITRLAILQNPD